jgi:PGF-pre-PGF domain-containing protein
VGVELPPATVSAGTATAISNTTVSVPIRARNATDVVTFGANISYDPALANVTAVSGTGAEASTVTIDNETGTLRFEYRYAERDTPAVNVTFDADTATGTSTPITVGNVTVETAGPQEPPIRTANGRLTVFESTVNVTNSTLNVTTVRPDDTVAVTATVTNSAPVAGQFGVPFRVNSSQEGVRNVTLAANATTIVRFTYTPTETGTTTFSVGAGAPQTLTVDAIAVSETSTSTTVEGQTAPGTPLNASLTGTNGTTDAGVSLNRVNVSTTREADVSLEVNVSADSSGAPPLGDAAAYLNVSESVSEDTIGTVTFGFTVDTDQLSDPEAAELYRYHDGTWNALDTTYLGERNGEYRFESISPGLSIFAVGQPTTAVDTDGGNDVDLGSNNEPEPTPGSTPDPTTPSTPAPSTATPASTSEDIDTPETPSGETRTSEPPAAGDTSQPPSTPSEPSGFSPPLVVLVVALLAGIIAVTAILRRRDML